MRRLTDSDLTNIAGTTIEGYHIEGVRIKRGPFSDSNNYGIILGKNPKGNYVTWEFHLDENDNPNCYWGHYFMENREAAIKDFSNRDMDDSDEDSESSCIDKSQEGNLLKRFKVTITETLKLTVEVEAENKQEAEEIVAYRWSSGKYILGAENFDDVEFGAATILTQHEP